ncbi:MAG: hypothetical protein JOY81_14285 [Alphaproteobacteria bacterium]|nr:hypothetical protein [Alphaproteobacteria bacterium]
MRQAAASSRRPIGPAVLFLLFAALYAIFIARTTFHHDGRLVGTLFDDALISLRYAFNVHAGAGAVWNPGEVPPVEGYSDPLWMLVMSATFFFGSWLIAPILVSAVGAVVLLLCGWSAWRIARAVGSDRATAFAAAFLALACYPTVFWTLRGMEVGLVTLFVMLGLLVVARPPRDGAADRPLAITSLLAGLAYLTRPDSILLFAPMLALQVLPLPRALSLLSPRGVLALSPAALCVAGQLAFRWLYYGELNPNTYYLKMTGVPLADRLASGLDHFLDAAPTIVLVLVPVLWLLGRRAAPAQTRLAWSVVGIVAIQSIYLVAIGGDAWGPDNSNRFVATVTPPLLTAAVLCLPDLWAWLGERKAALALVAAILLGGSLLLQLSGHFALSLRSNMPIAAGAVLLCAWPFAMKRTLVAAALSLFLMAEAPGWIRWTFLNAASAGEDIVFARQGLFLRERLPPGASFAAFWLGAPSYYSGLKSIDLYGKTDKHVARVEVATPFFRPGHNKMDLDYSVGRLRPDVVLGVGPKVMTGFGYIDLGNEIWLRPDFAARLPDKARLAEPWCAHGQSIYCPL